MTKNKQKLELTWIGKDEEIRLEPRILIEDPTKSYGDPSSENMLIHGDNLLALKALEQDFAGKIKCIYIDPPYNIDAAGVPYDDFIEHSKWLCLMKPRLEILYNLLASDGLFAVQIDDNEFARLYLLLSEVFKGEKNLKTIVVKMSEASGKKMAAAKKYGMIPKIKEYIILAKKSGVRSLDVELIPKGKWDSEYNIFLDGFEKADKALIDEILLQDKICNEDIVRLDAIAVKIKLKSLASILESQSVSKDKREQWCYENAFRICQCAASESVQKLTEAKRSSCEQEVFFVKSKRGENAYMVRPRWSEASKKPRVQLIFAEDNLNIHPGDIWTDIRTTGINSEGGVKFKNSKKPEALIKRIIEMSSKKGDFILDSFLGSGTTIAVAHKLRRKWIGIELGEHANTLCHPRLKSIVEGSDWSGITSMVGWQGGGGFKFYELAPSLLNKDKHGQWIISKEYKPDMLAAALCKHEGFTYCPDPEIYWKQGRGSEADFIYTTTSYITPQSLDAIAEDMQPGESLIIWCKAYQPACDEQFSNITIKKIPQMLLGKCEFGKDDYSLNIVNVPQLDSDVEEEIDEEPSVEESTSKPA